MSLKKEQTIVAEAPEEKQMWQSVNEPLAFQFEYIMCKHYLRIAALMQCICLLVFSK